MQEFEFNVVYADEDDLLELLKSLNDRAGKIEADYHYRMRKINKKRQRLEAMLAKARETGELVPLFRLPVN